MKDLQDLYHVNLNLLLPLKELLDRRNVSAAAEALSTTQSTMSRHMAQLRGFFDDPLLVRSGNSYILTPRALEIHGVIDDVLSDLAGLFTKEFNPRACRQDFKIAVPDYVNRYVLGEALAPFLGDENSFTFSILNWDAFARDMLLAGDLHLASSLDDVFPSNIYRRIIDEDRMVCVMRRDHPALAGDGLVTDDFAAAGFVIIKTGGGHCKPIDECLAKKGIKRRIKLTVPGYSAAFAAIQHSDLLAVVPRHVAVNSVSCRELAVVPLPFEAPLLRYSLWWHERFHNDVAHRWLRDHVVPRILTHPKHLGLSVPV